MALTKVSQHSLGNSAVTTAKINLTTPLGIANSTANVIYMAANGNVGVGTSAPATQMQLTRSNASGDVGLLISQGADGYTNTTSTATLYLGATYNATGQAAKIVASHSDGTTGDHGQNLQLWTVNSGSTPTERMRIAANGNIGIGTTTPGYAVDLGSKTDAIKMPIGTTAQRPTSAAGLLRYNSSKQTIEGVLSTQWSRDWQPLTLAPCFYGFNSIDTTAVSGWKTIRVNADFNCGLGGASIYNSTTGRVTPNEEGWYMCIFGHGHQNGSHDSYRQNIYHGTFGDVAAQWQPYADRTTLTAVTYMNGSDHWVAPNVYHGNASHADDNGGRVIFFAVFRILGADNG